MTVDEFQTQLAVIESEIQRLQEDWEADGSQWRQAMLMENERVTLAEQKLVTALNLLQAPMESYRKKSSQGVELFLFCSKRLATRLQYFSETASQTFAKYTWLNLLKIHHLKIRQGLGEGRLAEEHLISIMNQKRIEDENRASILREMQTIRSKITLVQQKYLAMQITKENHRAYNSLQISFTFGGMEAMQHPLMKSFDRFLKGLLMPVVYPMEFQQLRHALNSYVKLSRAYLDACRDEAITNHREVEISWSKLRDLSADRSVNGSRLREQLEKSKLNFHARQGKLVNLPLELSQKVLRGKKMPLPIPTSEQQVTKEDLYGQFL